MQMICRDLRDAENRDNCTRQIDPMNANSFTDNVIKCENNPMASSAKMQIHTIGKEKEIFFYLSVLHVRYSVRRI